jgi:hypothetical protein
MKHVCVGTKKTDYSNPFIRYKYGYPYIPIYMTKCQVVLQTNPVHFILTLMNNDTQNHISLAENKI